MKLRKIKEPLRCRIYRQFFVERIRKTDDEPDEVSGDEIDKSGVWQEWQVCQVFRRYEVRRNKLVCT